jgi:putative ABC transport system permease protein
MRLYNFLLYLYPASFRGEYGRELYRIFSDRRSHASNPLSVLSLWASEFVDILINAAFVHWDILRQDVRYTARTLVRAPGFALTAIVVTGLGIGANTAVFSVTDRALLHPLPFADSDRLVQIWQKTPLYSRFELSPPNFYDWRKRSTSFEDMSAHANFAWNFLGQGGPQRLEGSAVTPEFFRILGIKPIAGRVITQEDARQNAPKTVVLSYSFWQNVFGGRQDALGQTIRLDDDPRIVIGVMPPDFAFPLRAGQLWIPLPMGDPPTDSRTNFYLSAIGKLKPGVSLEQARAEMSVISEALAREYPKEIDTIRAGVDPLSDQVPSQTRLLLWALLGASLCVLLIACTNLASLLLAKAMARRRELTVRAAIGAGRERLVRQLLTESLSLSAVGGALGVVVAMAALPVLWRILPASLPLREATVVDHRVLGFTALVTLATGLLFGVLPAWRVCSGVDHEGLREGSRAGIGGRRERLRSVLVVVEIMASVVLLVSSGLLIRALWRIRSTDPGFRADSVLTMQTWLPMPRYELNSSRTRLYTEVLSNVRALPGVINAAYISSVPMGPQGGGIWPVTGTGAESNERDSNGIRNVGMRLVSSGYFDTMRISLRAGRDILDSDDLRSAPVAVVSESFAQRYWPNQDPLGRKFHFAFDHFPFAEQDRTVVGVVEDVRFRGLERPSEPQVYLSYKQLPDRTSPFYAPKALMVRFAGDGTGLAPPIRDIIRKADPEIPITAVQPLRDFVDLQTASRSTQIRIIGSFAALSLLLAGIGIYGLLSFAVGQRSPEFGLRIALGAHSLDILSLVLREGVVLAVSGSAIGLLVSYFAGRSMRALLADIGPFDPATAGTAGIVVLAMTLLGSLLPALRAMRTAPTTVIRAE